MLILYSKNYPHRFVHNTHLVRFIKKVVYKITTLAIKLPHNIKMVKPCSHE